MYVQHATTNSTTVRYRTILKNEVKLLLLTKQQLQLPHSQFLDLIKKSQCEGCIQQRKKTVLALPSLLFLPVVHPIQTWQPSLPITKTNRRMKNENNL